MKQANAQLVGLVHLRILHHVLVATLACTRIKRMLIFYILYQNFIIRTVQMNIVTIVPKATSGGRMEGQIAPRVLLAVIAIRMGVQHAIHATAAVLAIHPVLEQ